MLAALAFAVLVGADFLGFVPAVVLLVLHAERVGYSTVVAAFEVDSSIVVVGPIALVLLAPMTFVESV